MSLDLYSYLYDSLKEIESILKQCGCKQITLNKNGSYRPVKIGIRSYTSLCYGTLTGFNNDSDKNIRILLGTAPYRGSEKLFIVIKKAELGNLSIREYTTISDYYTGTDYLIENVAVGNPISFIRDELVKTIQSIKNSIDREFVLSDQAVQKFLIDTNTRFNTVSSLVRDGLLGLGCKDISVDSSKQKELTKENGKTEISFSFEVPKSELFMNLTLSISLQDYDYKEKRSSIHVAIYFSPIWITDPSQIKDINQLKDKLEFYSCNAYIVRDSDVEHGVSEIINRVNVLDTMAKKNMDLYNSMVSGDLSIKNADILNMSNILSHLPDLFVKALQKNNVSELDKGEKAYYNNLVKIKKEYDSGNYDTLEDLYSMFKFCCSEIQRKVKNLQGKKGVADQYNALFDLYFHKINGVWEKIAEKFNDKTMWSLL